MTPPADPPSPDATHQPAAPYRELMIGCGRRRTKDVSLPERKEFTALTTLDINADHAPDVVWDLMTLPLPFEADTFDEIHAYEVLEHTGVQGDYRFFFAQFTDFWRILKPGGYLFGSCPMPHSRWTFGDPSHSRVIQKESFLFLDQMAYARGVGTTTMSDFRYLYRADFETAFTDETDGILKFALRALKPSRIDALAAKAP